MGNMGNTLRLSPQTVYSAVLKGKKTFEEIYPPYGFSCVAAFEN